MKNEQRTFEDERGSLTPISVEGWEHSLISYNKSKFTFRGLHYQDEPTQTKYVKVIKGSIIDFLYNLETKEVKMFELNNQEAILVPDNYAHGFLTLEDDTILTYLIRGKYNPNTEHSVVWNDVPLIKEKIQDIIGNNPLIISDKDRDGK